MSCLLLAAKGLVAESAGEVCPAQIEEIRKQYREILAAGMEVNPPPVRAPGQKGRAAKGKALNLLTRFAEYEEEVLAFVIHGVPFDNNEAERDLRMMKTRQKISGCFRSLDWANRFAKIRSVITSAKKKAVNVYGILQQMLTNPEKAEDSLFGT